MTGLRVGVVGVGHLGKEHARILAGLPGIELAGVADVNFELARGVATRLGTRAYSDYRGLFGSVDAVVVAVPTAHHHAVAADCLARGLPLLVEKPLAATPEQAEELVELSRRHGTLLQVGHIERFNPAFEELQRRPLRPRVLSCRRMGPFTGRSTDVGAVLDLMVHDLDLVLALVNSPVESVHAAGVTLLGGHEDVAQAQLVFANGCVAEVTASRANPVPVRQMQVWGPEGHASLDFARRSLTLVQPTGRRDGGGLETLELDRSGGDQLTRELQEFVQCLRTGGRPRATGEAGRDAVVLAGRILRCIAAAGEGRPATPPRALFQAAPPGPGAAAA